MCYKHSIRRCIYFFAVSLSFIQPAYSQEVQDSLHQQLAQMEAAERVPILNQLLIETRRSNSPQAIGYGKEALEILAQFPDDSLLNASTYLLGTAYMGTANHDTVLVLAEESIALSESLKDTLQLARSILLIGDVHFRQSNYETSVHEVSRAKELFSLKNDSSGIAMCALTLGNLHNSMGNYDTAIRHYQQAKDIRRAQGIKTMVAMITSNTGVAYRRKGDYNQAIKYYAEALDLFEQLNNDLRRASTLTNLGTLSTLLGNNDEALDFHQRALDLSEKLGRHGSVAISLSNIASIHSHQGNFETALDFNQRALSIQEEIGNRSGVAQSLNNVGAIHFRQKNYDEALSYYSQSLAIRRDIGDPEHIVMSLHNLVELNTELENESQAYLHANEALTTSKEIGNIALIRDSNKHLATLYERSGKHKEALEAYKKYKMAGDSLFTKDSQAIITEIQTQYQTREQEQTIQILEQNRAIQRLWMGGLIGSVILFGAIAIIGYNGYLIKRRSLGELAKAHDQLKSTQARLIQQEKLASLGQITAGIAHEIKNPLNFINNFSLINQDLISELEEEEESQIKDQQDLLSDIKSNQARILHHGQRVNEIVLSMMQHAHEVPSKMESVDVNELVSKYLDIAYNGIQARYPGIEISVQKDFQDDLDEVRFVPQDIGKVIVNLLQNAVDALQENSDNSLEPRITVTTKQSDEATTIQVADNGPGMSKTTLARIFEPFYTTKEPGKGTGLGLSISYDIVTKAHGGQLDVESQKGEGSSFTIRLPRG